MNWSVMLRVVDRNGLVVAVDVRELHTEHMPVTADDRERLQQIAVMAGAAIQDLVERKVVAAK